MAARVEPFVSVILLMYQFESAIERAPQRGAKRGDCCCSEDFVSFLGIYDELVAMFLPNSG